MKYVEKIRRMVSAVVEIAKDETKTTVQTPRKFALKDWKNALQQTFLAVRSKQLTILAAGVSYFLTLAVFPAIAAAVAIASFILSRSQLTDTVAVIESYLPSDLANLVSTQLQASFNDPSSGLFIIIVGIAVALFSLSGAVSNSINASNVVYAVEENRSFVKLRLVSLGFIAMAGGMLSVVIALLLLNETILEGVGLPAVATWTILIGRWFIIAALVAAGLAVYYRYAPNRTSPHWQWVTWGSCIATLLWLLGTTLFFVYARYFAHYTDAYSVFAGIIVLMIWLNLTAFAVLLGGEINYRLENQTRAKTSP